MPNELRFCHDPCVIYIQNTNVLIHFPIYFADALIHEREKYYRFSPMLNEEGKKQFKCVANEVFR